MKNAALIQIAVAKGAVPNRFNKFESRGVASSYGRLARRIGLVIDNSPLRPNERHYWMELLCVKNPNPGPYNSTSWIIRDRFVKALKAEKVI